MEYFLFILNNRNNKKHTNFEEINYKGVKRKMNLINCSEDCRYQLEGYCKLEKVTGISSVKVNGCSYFRARKKEKKDKPIENNLYLQ